MNDIEKMLRDGVSAEDIINEVNKTKARITKEEEARKKAELEKEKSNAKIAAARANAINAVIQYVQTLGIEFTEEEAKKIITVIEAYCKQVEDEISELNYIKANKNKMTDDDKFNSLLKLIF